MDLSLEKGYSMNDTVGREGIERAYEDVLRGTDGERLIERDASYNVTDVTESSAAVPGDTVVLTIDKNIQRAAMEALKEEIAYLNANAPEGQGREADAGAVVAIDIKTSEVLACVTYPTYNLETYAEDFAANSSDPLNPFWNRALSGVYAPGSTFKPTVAIAGLTEGIITPETQVQCARVYTYFSDYQPTCLSAHGMMTVMDALRASCNIFFYDTGRQVGIETINRYAQALGLGVPTGVELTEATGTQCDPNTVNPGDVLQASIGQLDNGYTPIQLANYVATIARRGVRTNVSLVKSISSYFDYEDVIETHDVEVLSTLDDVPDEVWDTVFEGMRRATHATNGTSYSYLGDYPITVGSKTGTPQTKEFPNSTFICFAPLEDPQIAIAVVIEKGWHGYTGAPVARAVLDAYFFPEDEEETAEDTEGSAETASAQTEDAASAPTSTAADSTASAASADAE
jgi:penicillin-binding protein 2